MTSGTRSSWRARPAGWSPWSRRSPSRSPSPARTRWPGPRSGAPTPPDLDVPRVRGTKNPDLAAIAALRPDLVLANQEENRRVDVERLRAAGIPVWVTVIRTLDEAIASLRRMFTVALGWPEPPWLAEAERAWRDPAPGAAHPGGHPDLARPVDGGRLGHLHRRPGRPPRPGQRLRRPPRALPARRPRRPGRPAARAHRAARRALRVHREPTARRCSPGHRVALVEGRSLTWYGPSLVTARARLAAQLSSAI